MKLALLRRAARLPNHNPNEESGPDESELIQPNGSKADGLAESPGPLSAR
jgi:hypothetical protein